ncbi:MAG TPA: ROK family protein [Candidatus Sulfotelmatobacter sp.]|nr:ROK family protein [Candidatus Sulfotelmatobacter sp.]
MAVIALDLGGTKLGAAIVSSRGKILYKHVAALAGRKGTQVFALITRELKGLFAFARARKIQVRGIGISVPGICYSKTGKVWAPNVPGWNNFPLRDRIIAVAPKKIPVTIESDRACYILGDAWLGSARGCNDAIFLAIGTGIGAGILVDGKILRGANDIAGAIGWLALAPPWLSKYKSCGCFEYHASGAGLVNGSRSSRYRSAEEIFRAYEAGAPDAKSVLNQAVQFWGMAAANLVSLFNPQKIIFGGGVFGPARRLLPQIMVEAKKWAQPLSIGKVKFEVSKLGGDAGLYGAACLALQARGNTG